MWQFIRKHEYTIGLSVVGVLFVTFCGTALFKLLSETPAGLAADRNARTTGQPAAAKSGGVFRGKGASLANQFDNELQSGRTGDPLWSRKPASTAEPTLIPPEHLVILPPGLKTGEFSRTYPGDEHSTLLGERESDHTDHNVQQAGNFSEAKTPPSNDPPQNSPPPQPGTRNPFAEGRGSGEPPAPRGRGGAPQASGHEIQIRESSGSLPANGAPSGFGDRYKDFAPSTFADDRVAPQSEQPPASLPGELPQNSPPSAFDGSSYGTAPKTSPAPPAAPEPQAPVKFAEPASPPPTEFSADTAPKQGASTEASPLPDNETSPFADPRYATDASGPSEPSPPSNANDSAAPNRYPAPRDEAPRAAAPTNRSPAPHDHNAEAAQTLPSSPPPPARYSNQNDAYQAPAQTSPPDRPEPRAFAADPPGEPLRQEHRYQVQPGDSYWSISERLYGSGKYYRALAAHNQDRPESNRLRAGDNLSIPPVDALQTAYPKLIQNDAPTRRSTPERPAPLRTAQTSTAAKVYVVQEGDTLFDIARYVLGKASRWVEIYELNRDLLGDDVNYLQPGMKLLLPAANSGLESSG